MNPTDTGHDDPLDQMLAQYRVEPANPDLRERILASARIQDQQPVRTSALFKELLRSIGGWPIAGPALAFSLLCGVSIDLLTHTDGSSAATDTAVSNADSTTIWELALLSTDAVESQELLP